MKWKYKDSKKCLQATLFALTLLFLISGHVWNGRQQQDNIITRSTELGSVSLFKPKAELDIKMADPVMSQMWGIHSMKAQAAWDKLKALGSRDIKVAIIDTGIDVHHPDLQHNL